MSNLDISNVRKTVNECQNNGKIYLSSNAHQNWAYSGISLNSKRLDSLDHVFSDQLDDSSNPMNQHSAGLCWACAGIEIFRTKLISQYKLPNDFNISLNHILFWDKLEKCNYFMEFIIENKTSPINSSDIKDILWSPCGDGHYWHGFAELISKYGLIPESVNGVRHSTKSTCKMNKLIKHKLREFAAKIMSPNNFKSYREFKQDFKNKSDGKSKKRRIDDGYPSTELGFDEVRKIKEEFMRDIIKILYINLGEPVYPDTNFDWVYKDKDNVKKTVPDMTPIKFYRKICGIDFADFRLVINDPRVRHPYYRVYSKESVPGMWTSRDDKDSHVVINLPMDDIKDLIMKQIDGGIPIWMACDVSKYVSHHDNHADPEIYDYSTPYDTSFETIGKADRLDFCDSYANHAMSVTGYDLNDTKKEIRGEKDKIMKKIKGLDKELRELKEKKRNKKSISGSKGSDAENSESKESESKGSESKGSESKGSESKGSDAENSESKDKSKEESEDGSKGKEKKPRTKKEIRKELQGLKDSMESVYKKSIPMFAAAKVKNSWGKNGDHYGIYRMTSEWCDEYLYEVLIHKDYFNEKQKKVLEQEPKVLNENDSLGMKFPHYINRMVPGSDNMVSLIDHDMMENYLGVESSNLKKRKHC